MAIYQWQRAVARALRLAQSCPGVLGVDYGFVYKAGIRLKTLGVRFHVAAKVPLSELPPTHVLPPSIDTFRCDVVEARYALHGNPRGQCDPLQPGVSIGNAARTNTSGTLGVMVKDLTTNAPGLLSNWHVLCGSPDAQPQESITQPSPFHAAGDPLRPVAKLKRWLNLDTGSDAAFALLDGGWHTSEFLFDNSVEIRKTQAPRNGMKLVKYGATSGLTHGMIDGIGGAYAVDYSDYDDKVRWIDGVRIIPDPDATDSEVSLAGDSGAVWVSPESNAAVALHFAGEDGAGPLAEYALAQPLNVVFARLDVSLL